MQPAPESNDPAEYVGPIGRSRILAELIADLPREARILEIGCNVGRNLAHLFDSGWSDVSGVEINPHAVELLRETYPQLRDAEIYVGPAEDVLPKVPNDSYDLVFTMAVLEHIHPSSEIVFDRMVAIAPRVLAIEPRGSLSHRTYPHDIPALFRSRGMRLESESQLGTHAEADPAFNDTIAWRFTRL
jgi:SAM-dependent methyltransferase